MLHARLASILINLPINVCLVLVAVGYVLPIIIVVCVMLGFGWQIIKHVLHVGGSAIIVGLAVSVCSVILAIMLILKGIVQHVVLFVLPATLAAQTVRNAR